MSAIRECNPWVQTPWVQTAIKWKCTILGWPCMWHTVLHNSISNPIFLLPKIQTFYGTRLDFYSLYLIIRCVCWSVKKGPVLYDIYRSVLCYFLAQVPSVVCSVFQQSRSSKLQCFSFFKSEIFQGSLWVYPKRGWKIVESLPIFLSNQHLALTASWIQSIEARASIIPPRWSAVP